VSEPSIFLLAYPRTASNWLLFILEYCSGIQIASPTGVPDSTVNIVNIGKPVPASAPVIQWAHRLRDFKHFPEDNNNSTLIYVHRDRIEVCVSFYASQLRADPDTLTAQLNQSGIPHNLTALAQWHAENEQIWAHWKGPKHLIEYEKLVTDPCDIVHQLEKVIPINLSRLEDFTTNAENYQAQFLAWKIKAGSKGLPVNTLGKDFQFWNNKLNDQVKLALKTG
jgi:hypothetical protein